MKFYRKIILLFAAVSLITFTACDDDLDVQPFNSLTTDSSFQTVGDFRLAVDGMYSQLLAGGFYGGTAMSGLPDILSDNVILSQAGRQSNRNNFEYNYTSNNNSGLINEAYEIINLANIIIARIDNLPVSSDRDDIFAQALAMRALAHFDMVRTYGQIPTQSTTANADLGMPYIKFEDGDTGNPFAQPSRDTVGENYQDIVSDLLDARSLIASNNGEGRFNSNAVNALLARAYLYMGEWQNAIDATNLVTATLSTIANYPDVFTDVSADGVILSAPQNVDIDNVTVGVIWSQAAGGDVISEYAVDFAFLQLIAANDVRRGVITIPGNNNGIMANAINKVGIDVNGTINPKLIRTAEVFLTRAEAQFNLGLEAEALITLDALRVNRYTGAFPTGETGQNLEDAIQLERRIELAFESHRFFDIKRRGESVQRSIFGDLIDGTGTPADIQILPAGDNRFQYPIPIAEINNNPNFAQNPGY